MTVCVAVVGRLRAYRIDAVGVARPAGDYAALPASVPEATYEADDGALYVRCGARRYVVVLPTCEHCHAPVDGAGVYSADRRLFCDAGCREEWRWTLP